MYLKRLYIIPFKVISIEKYTTLQPRFPGFEAFPEVGLRKLKVSQPSFAYTSNNKLGVRWQFPPIFPEILCSHFVQFPTKCDRGRLFRIYEKLFLALLLHNGGLFCSRLGTDLNVTLLINNAQCQELGAQFICLIPTFRINSFRVLRITNTCPLQGPTN